MVSSPLAERVMRVGWLIPARFVADVVRLVGWLVMGVIGGFIIDWTRFGGVCCWIGKGRRPMVERERASWGMGAWQGRLGLRYGMIHVRQRCWIRP